MGAATAVLKEGGWWFDTGVPIGSIPVELTGEERERVSWEFQHRHGIDMPGAPDTWLYTDKHVQALRDELQDKARRVQREWAQFYPVTSKRTSVLGGEDHDVRIEDHFAQPYPTHRPHYE